MPQKFLIAVVAAVTMLLLLAVAVWAYDDSQKDQISSGITVGGVDVGGPDSARKVIKNQVVEPLRQPVVVSYDGKNYTLSPSQLRQSADVDGMVQEAVDRSREGGIFDRVTRYASGGEVNADLEPRVSYDKSAVKDFVNQLAEQIDQEPVDAAVVPAEGGSKLQKKPGEAGLAVQKGDTTTAIYHAALSPGRDAAIQPVVEETKPDVRTKDLPREYARYILIDRSDYTLRFFHSLRLQKSYPIAVGQQGLETPAGLYRTTDKQVNPSWHVPNSDWAGSLAGQVIPPGPADPLKARWIGIVDGAGIHGTDDIGSLGSAASHGCVRMSIPDVIELYDRVEIGDAIYVL
jgi:lipoprotein-anchoring transpeptidase ErfK/SrfK